MTYWNDRALTIGGRDTAFHGVDWDSGTQQMVDLVLPWLPDSGTVADLGCGVGRMAAPIATARPDLTVVGVDESEAMLAQHVESPDNVTYLQADVGALPFDEVVGVYSVLVVQHLTPEQVAAMFAELRRVLVPGGRFVCQWVRGDYHAPNDHRYKVSEMYAMTSLTLVDWFDGVHPDWQWGVWEA